MGIKHFFKWFKETFPSNIRQFNGNHQILMNAPITDLLIDANGLFHNATQKIFKYGNGKSTSLLAKNITVKQTVEKQIETFQYVCHLIEQQKNMSNPTERIIICVDGSAPLSKQRQQRSRRFVSGSIRDPNAFDGNSITPGTKFMDSLTRYIDWFIKKKISEDEAWKNINVVFSNEKCPGEGEYKLLQYTRRYGNPNNSYCICGMDADLIMLALASKMPNFHILREDNMHPNTFYLVNIGAVRIDLANMMKWDSHEYIPDRAIDDFIFMCFTVGNDFLPHIPGIEIAMGSIERMIQIYKQVSLSVGHLTKRKSGVLRFRPRAVKLFMNAISVCEEDVFSEKLNKPAEYFPDPMMEKCSFSGKIDVDLYRRTYSTCHFVEESGSSLSLNSAVKDACHSYLEGMQWVLSYYTSGVPDWKWSYHYNYAPFAHDISAHIDSFEFKEYGQSKAVLPFVQLLCVLPPSSAKLIPAPLNTLLENRESSLAKYYPEKFRIDICGKRQEWEGVAILPFVDYDIVENEYKKIEHLVDKNEEKRNRVGKTFSYKKCNETYELKSYYGNYPCSVKTEFIEL